jgi:uncharacterized membrane protein
MQEAGMTKAISRISRGYFHRAPRLFRVARRRANIHRIERGISMLVGAGLVALGFRRRLAARLGLSAAAGALIGRGLTGRSHFYRVLRLTTA